MQQYYSKEMYHSYEVIERRKAASGRIRTISIHSSLTTVRSNFYGDLQGLDVVREMLSYEPKSIRIVGQILILFKKYEQDVRDYHASLRRSDKLVRMKSIRIYYT